MTNKREEIAWLAADAIAERGLAGASLREVAARTGASLGVVTYHFSNRDDLLAATMETVVAAIRRRAETGRDADPVERELSAVLPLTAATRRETAVWVAFTDAATRDPGLAAQFEAYYREWEHAVAAALEDSGGGGRFAPVLIATTDGIAVRALVSGMSGSRQRGLLRRAISAARAASPGDDERGA